MRRPHALWPGPLLALLIAPGAMRPAAPAAAPGLTPSEITIKATFQFRGADNNTAPIAGAYCELRDYDPISDDVLAYSATDEFGIISFTYDSGLDDGWLSGRVDPYVRCYSRLYAGSGDRLIEKAVIVKTGRKTPGSFLTNASPYTIDTQTWDDNNESRTVTVTDETDGRHAFGIMAMLAFANARQPKPDGTLLDTAPMALQGNTCAGWTSVVYPDALPTGFLSSFNEIYVQPGYESDFDTIVHEYGHHEMWDAYGSNLFGNYSRSRGDHSFTGIVGDESLSWNAVSSGFADPRWTAFAEAWADFAAVITKGYPRYRGQNVETDDTQHSDRCEGTICRIFWDIWDTSADKVIDLQLDPRERPRLAGVAADDDPFGFIPRPPFSGLPGRAQLKQILRLDKPKSLGDFRTAFLKRHGANALTKRAFESVLYRHGIRDGITAHVPELQLTVSGAHSDTTYTGTVTMSATVADADITPQTPEDGRLMHVAFYWTPYSELGQSLSGDDPTAWHALCVDTDGADGWHCAWPATASDRPTDDTPLVITAIASDFFERSAYGVTKATLTGAQFGPIRVPPGTTADGSGGELSADAGGPLAAEGDFHTGLSVASMRYDDGYLLLANGMQGLKIYEASGSPDAPLSTYKPAGWKYGDSNHDVDTFTRPDAAGRVRRFAALAMGSHGLRIVDITAPLKPVEVGALTTVPDRTPGGPTGLNARLVAVQETYAYVAVGSGIAVVDIANPRAPREVAYWAPARQGSCGEIRGIRVHGSVAYLACSGTGLTMLDLGRARAQRVYVPHLARKDPSMVLPESMILGSYKPEGGIAALDVSWPPVDGRTWAVALEVNHARGASSRAHVVDVTNARAPVRVSDVVVPRFPHAVHVAGSRAYIGHSQGLMVVDISGQGTARIKGEYRRPTLWTADRLEAFGTRVFVSTGETVHVLRVQR